MANSLIIANFVSLAFSISIQPIQNKILYLHIISWWVCQLREIIWFFIGNSNVLLPLNGLMQWWYDLQCVIDRVSWINKIRYLSILYTREIAPTTTLYQIVFYYRVSKLKLCFPFSCLFFSHSRLIMFDRNPQRNNVHIY